MNHGPGGIFAPQPVTLATPHFAFRVVQARHLSSFDERCVQSFVRAHRNRSLA